MCGFTILSEYVVLQSLGVVSIARLTAVKPIRAYLTFTAINVVKDYVD